MTEKRKYGKFYGVGLGPGDPQLLTLKAVAVLRNVPFIFLVASRQSARSVSGSILDSLTDVSARKIELEFTMSRDFTERLARIDEHAERILAELSAGNDCAFATIGDSMTYSTCGYLLRALLSKRPELEYEIVPGVNSWSALAAASAVPLAEDNEILKIVPGYLAPDSAEFEAAGTMVLLKTYREREQYLKMLEQHGFNVLYGANLGLENEFLSTDSAEISTRPQEYLSIMIGKRKK